MNHTVKTALIISGATGAGLAAILTGVAVYHSRQMKMLRAYKKTEKILGRTATILQSISEAMG